MQESVNWLERFGLPTVLVLAGLYIVTRLVLPFILNLITRLLDRNQEIWEMHSRSAMAAFQETIRAFEERMKQRDVEFKQAMDHLAGVVEDLSTLIREDRKK